MKTEDKVNINFAWQGLFDNIIEVMTEAKRLLKEVHRVLAVGYMNTRPSGKHTSESVLLGQYTKSSPRISKKNVQCPVRASQTPAAHFMNKVKTHH